LFSGRLALDLLVRYNERLGESILELAALSARQFDIGLVNEKGIDRRLLETQ